MAIYPVLLRQFDAPRGVRHCARACCGLLYGLAEYSAAEAATCVLDLDASPWELGAKWRIWSPETTELLEWLDPCDEH